MDPQALGLVLTISDQALQISELKNRIGALTEENAILRATLAEKEGNAEQSDALADAKGDNK